ncbi:methyltransferase [Acetobacteraceae bacterium H6797]|nr:methyltransferase [Acetobacteraceae bacterium H6797]
MSDWPDGALTEDRLLDGRVTLSQPRQGLRAGLDAVLLAASIPAKPGQTVIEAGCGAGAVFLCLLARVPGLKVVAVEREPRLAALARANAEANGHAGQVQVILGDIADAAVRTLLPRADHAFANPPWWPDGTVPPEAIKAGATHLGGNDLAAWAKALTLPLAHRGSLTMVLPAALWPMGSAALAEAGCGAQAMLPLWPRVGQPARRALIQGRREAKGPARLLPGLVLHEGEGWSAEADAVLRGRAEIGWG